MLAVKVLEKGMRDKKTWQWVFVARLIDHGKFSLKEAVDNLFAGMNTHDYDSNPEDAADDELSYWEIE